MRMNRWLWVLWVAMIVSMILKRQVDTYMVVALIILPILIVLLDLHEEIVVLKEENKHQRKFVMDRYNLLQEKLTDVSSQIEKRLVVDFAEFSKANTEAQDEADALIPRSEGGFQTPAPKRRKSKKRVKKRQPEPDIDFTEDFTEEQDTEIPPADDDDFEDI
jgi:hypothetical protein